MTINVSGIKIELYAIYKRHTQSKRNQKGYLGPESEIQGKPKELYSGNHVNKMF